MGGAPHSGLTARPKSVVPPTTWYLVLPGGIAGSFAASAVGRSSSVWFDHRRCAPASPCSVPTLNEKPGIGKGIC